MFHAKGGLYFERQVDSSVKVVLKTGGVPPDYRSGPSDFEVTLDPLTWASVVAAVSKRGNTVEVIEAALGLHEQPQGYVEIHARDAGFIDL